MTNMKWDNRYLMIGAIIFILIPLFRPMGIPVPVSEYTSKVYNYINELPEDSVVILAMNIAVGNWPEQGPFLLAGGYHILSRPLKLVIVSFGVDCPLLVDRMLREIDMEKNFPNKVYGEDYVIFGFLAGGETAYAQFCGKPYDTFKTDIKGTPVEKLPIMEYLKTTSDIKLVIHPSSHDADMSVRQFVTTFNLPYAPVPSIGWFPSYMPYYNAGQLVGFVTGVTGGAQYELLVSRPGKGLATSDALTLSFLFTILMMILGNIAEFYKRIMGTKGG